MAWSLLLVEDEPDIRHVIELALERDERFDVVACACGSDAVRQATSGGEPFDCVLLDYLLPDMSNADCVRKLRAARSTRAARLILVTAYVPSGGVATYLEQGLDAVILKPFDVLAFGDQIEAALTRGAENGMVYDRAWRSARRNASAAGGGRTRSA